MKYGIIDNIEAINDINSRYSIMGDSLRLAALYIMDKSILSFYLISVDIIKAKIYTLLESSNVYILDYNDYLKSFTAGVHYELILSARTNNLVDKSGNKLYTFRDILHMRNLDKNLPDDRFHYPDEIKTTILKSLMK